MPRNAYINRFELTVTAANVYGVTNCFGQKIWFESANAEFEFQLDDGEHCRGRRNLKFSYVPDFFNRIQIKNLSSVSTLKVIFWTGTADSDFGDTQLPPAKLVGWDFAKAVGASLALPGIATSAANYAAHGVPAGARRERVNISSRAGVTGRISVTNTLTGKLLYVLPMPGCYTFPSDEDLTITNNTSENPTVVATEDVAVSEAFYP
jgi:hypothetical protein